MGFFGPNLSHIYALTTAEELHVWSLDELESPSIDFGIELRDNLSNLIGTQINYFIDCKKHPETGDLLLLGGSTEFVFFFASQRCSCNLACSVVVLMTNEYFVSTLN
jgi:hypothetical protein